MYYYVTDYILKTAVNSPWLKHRMWTVV